MVAQPSVYEQTKKTFDHVSILTLLLHFATSGHNTKLLGFGFMRGCKNTRFVTSMKYRLQKKLTLEHILEHALSNYLSVFSRVFVCWFCRRRNSRIAATQTADFEAVVAGSPSWRAFPWKLMITGLHVITLIHPSKCL